MGQLLRLHSSQLECVRLRAGFFELERGMQSATGKGRRMSQAAEAAIRRRLVPIETYRGYVDGEAFVSDWIVVDQKMIDTFAEATHDHQFIHVDPARAKAETPFGGTIAHGFLSLSLLSALAYDALPGVEGSQMGINYGFDRVRFMNPVKSGARVRGRFRLAAITERAVSVQSTWDVEVEIEGAVKPAFAARWLTLAMLAEPLS
jgi:acyl dehydratase